MTQTIKSRTTDATGSFEAERGSAAWGTGTGPSIDSPAPEAPQRWMHDATGDMVPSGTEFRPIQSGRLGRGRFEASKLRRISDLLVDIESDEPETMTLKIESLRAVLSLLWEQAVHVSDLHQLLLSILEAAVLSVESITVEQAAAMRGAAIDLSNVSLTQQHLDVTQSRFIDAGFSPLALLGEMGEDDDERFQ